MDFLTLASARYSCRKFKPEHLKQSDLDVILRAGQLAPTATNAQPQHILVLNTDEDCAKLKECSASQSHAPTAVLVCYDKTKCWTRSYDGKKSGEVDAAIITTHMMLAAAEIGVGSVWVMSFDPEKTRSALNLQEEYEPVAFLMMGYPAEDAVPTSRHTDRLALEETVSYGSF
ncbi:MAG: nitroreductase family protein [Lachnospiraceae bacterium]|nr:nitroreductase family protein [Lachnospiraceae bacterium]